MEYSEYDEFDLAADSADRATDFRIKLADYMKINRATLDREVYDFLSEAYSLTGNLQYNLNTLINEAKKHYTK